MQFMCSVWIADKQRVCLFTAITYRLLQPMHSVYCAVRSGSLNQTVTFKFDVFHPKMFIEYNGQMCQTQQNEYKTYNVTARLHVSTLNGSSSDPRDTDPNKECPRHCGIPSAYNICSE